MGVFAHWPNRITAMRFVGSMVLFAIFTYMQDFTVVPVEGKELISDHRFLAAFCFWLFVITAATDFLDGYLARRDKLVSAFGRIADPFTDKVLILGAMIYGAAMPWTQHFMPVWMVVVILARELLVTGIRSYVEKVGGEFPADGFGKIKMIAQCIAVGGLMWYEAYAWPEGWKTFWLWFIHAMVWITLIATLGSGVGYITKARKILSETEQ